MSEAVTAAPAAAPAPGVAPAATTGIPANVAPAAAPAAPTEGVTPAAEAPTPEQLITPPEPVATVLDSTTDADGAIEYEPTGDPGLDVALSYLGTLGFAGSDPAMQNAAKGDFALLEAKLAVMGEKAVGWERMIALAKQSYSNSETQRTEVVRKTEAAIVSVVGTVDQWKTIVQWAAENADPAEKKEINAMIDAGPVQARAAASLLLSAYSKASGTTVNPAPVAKDAAGSSVTAQGPLNYKDYATAVRELHGKLGNRMEGSQEYADLQRRYR